MVGSRWSFFRKQFTVALSNVCISLRSTGSSFVTFFSGTSCKIARRRHDKTTSSCLPLMSNGGKFDVHEMQSQMKQYWTARSTVRSTLDFINSNGWISVTKYLYFVGKSFLNCWWIGILVAYMYEMNSCSPLLIGRRTLTTIRSPK